MTDAESILADSGIKPTSNRILILRALLDSHSPLSLSELELKISTVDKSNISRILSLLLEHHLIHPIEDGRGIVKYEICHGHNDCTVNDMHVHFYCESCKKVFCFEDIPVPIVDAPKGFSIHTVNYMLKGICPKCKSCPPTSIRDIR